MLWRMRSGGSRSSSGDGDGGIMESLRWVAEELHTGQTCGCFLSRHVMFQTLFFFFFFINVLNDVSRWISALKCLQRRRIGCFGFCQKASLLNIDEVSTHRALVCLRLLHSLKSCIFFFFFLTVCVQLLRGGRCLNRKLSLPPPQLESGTWNWFTLNIKCTEHVVSESVLGVYQSELGTRISRRPDLKV